jgi:DNA-binding PadR family transcriptional regulator
MQAANLSDSAAGILTLIALRGPSSPYDLKRALTNLAAEFWDTAHTQLYSETARLAQAGLLSVDREDGGRRRQTYALTAAGRDALLAWLRAPSSRSMEIVDVAQLRLLASELLTEDEVRALAREQLAIYRARLAALDEIDRRFAAPGFAPRMRAVPLGRAVFVAAIAFWEALAEGREPPMARPVEGD